MIEQLDEQGRHAIKGATGLEASDMVLTKSVHSQHVPGALNQSAVNQFDVILDRHVKEHQPFHLSKETILHLVPESDMDNEKERGDVQAIWG